CTSFRSMERRFRSGIFFSYRWSGVFDRAYSFRIDGAALPIAHILFRSMEWRFRSFIFFSDRWGGVFDRSYSFRIDGVAFSIDHIHFRLIEWRFRSFIFFSDRWSVVFDRSYSFRIDGAAFSIDHSHTIFKTKKRVPSIKRHSLFIINMLLPSRPFPSLLFRNKRKCLLLFPVQTEYNVMLLGFLL